MDIEDRKRLVVIQKFITETFSESDWAGFGQLTESMNYIKNHDRLSRSLYNGDEDYPHCVAEVLHKICTENESIMGTIIDFYDIDIWYENKEPEKSERIFRRKPDGTAKFWINGYLKVFITHLAVSKEKAVSLKEALKIWGMSAFVAHEDIEPTKEWMAEIELGLGTMDILVAMVEPSFKESNWTDQEIGFALGRQVEIVPLRIGADPHGFMGKFQGIQAKGKYASDLSKDILKIVLKKPKLHAKIINAFNIILPTTETSEKVKRISEIDEINLLNPQEMKEILERSSLSDREKLNLKHLIIKYKAFEKEKEKEVIEDEIPF